MDVDGGRGGGSSSAPAPAPAAAPPKPARLRFTTLPDWLAIRYPDNPSPGWYFHNRVSVDEVKATRSPKDEVAPT